MSSGSRHGYSRRISSRVRSAATSPTTVPTVTRMPRMQGFPPITAGSRVMRFSCGMLSSSRPDRAQVCRACRAELIARMELVIRQTIPIAAMPTM